MTRPEFAHRLGVRPDTVRGWEQDAGHPKHRKPGGPAMKLLEELRRKLFSNAGVDDEVR